jgi:hypothetical protein
VTQSFEQASYWVGALAGDPASAVMDWRAIHDVDKTVAGHARRGTLAEHWSWLIEMNNAGYGIFATVNMMDGIGRELANVAYIRSQFVDLDQGDAEQQFHRAANWQPAPSFAVNSSPGKFHIYWPVQSYTGNDRFQLTQRKLRQLFNGDKRTIDASRVMRVPGFYHLKQPTNPHLVTMQALFNWGQRQPIESLEQATASINIIDGGIGVRHDLGDPSLAAPSLDWLKYALELVDPNELDRGEWIALTSAIKQAGWSVTSPENLFELWSAWCAKYSANDLGENLKQWNSIRNTELGWPSMLRRVPGLAAVATFGGRDRTGDATAIASHTAPAGQEAPNGAPVSGQAGTTPPSLDCSGEFLTHIEQQTWFAGCTFVVNRGEMLAPDGRFLGVTQFNATYGGKKFIIDSTGKTSNEAWAAATRSTLWTVPKVDHVRFLPSREYHEIVIDELGRKGINVYKPIEPKRVQGDPTPFLNHIAAILPDADDQRILFDYLAHNARFPGYKIPWAPVIQSVEGIGKGIIKTVIMHVMGRPYVYFPNAKELTNSGSQFNGWMRGRVFILADEIKVDDRRDLIEVLKPMISEEVIEVQSKGIDQDLEDNFSNWGFFTNWKDAIPVNKNGRRFAIFYSILQTVEDLESRGMNDTYFNKLYSWVKADGAAIVADWLLNYPIECGAIAMRAPKTSSTIEAVGLSRSPIERVIIEAVEDGLPGFRGGWISSIAAINRIKSTGAVGRTVQPTTVASVVEAMGYIACGRSLRPYFQEDKDVKSYLFHFGGPGDISQYGRLQGWE